jgi:hypothetical protein
MTDLPHCITDETPCPDLATRLEHIRNRFEQKMKEADASTENKYNKVDQWTEEQRPFWELKNMFGGIYTVIQRVLRKYADDDWKPLSDGTWFASIDASSGSPKVSNPGSVRNVVDIGWFFSLLELYYSYPGDMSVTCIQWQKFVGINNALARIYVTVQEYSEMRAKMPTPTEYFDILFREPIPLIGVHKYRAMMRHCLDYDPTTAEQLYPYYA